MYCQAAKPLSPYTYEHRVKWGPLLSHGVHAYSVCATMTPNSVAWSAMETRMVNWYRQKGPAPNLIFRGNDHICNFYENYNCGLCQDQITVQMNTFAAFIKIS